MSKQQRNTMRFSNSPNINPIRFRWAGRAYQVSQHRVDGPVERWKGVLRAFLLAPKLEVATDVEEFARTLTE